MTPLACPLLSAPLDPLLRCQRILVLGSPGSGKSQLADALASTTGLPLIRLDDLYWEGHWKRPEPDVFGARLQDVIAGEAWILDGNYAHWLRPRLERADAVVLLDVSPLRCLLSVSARELRRGMGERHSLPAAVRSAGGVGRLDPAFFGLVARFRSAILPGMLRLIDQRPSIVLVSLCGRAAVKTSVEQLLASAP